ncbi:MULTISPECIES: signal peptide peptidase SppA [Methylomonas]|uniref:Peptidase S49 n=1 Tax=Methylomonas koyamae TaxID=702114 RepID=A0A177P760_9GAMM|nr:signal peptide peptidase SppA [Methylomonas koyamae]OAI26021.1 peptidase S49 [Methylomonas koyamae]
MDTQNQNQEPEGQEGGWERQTLEKLAFAAINEQKIARRWGIFFKALTFVYLSAVLLVATYPSFEEKMSSDRQHAAVVDIVGVIADGEASSASVVIEGLQDAAEDKNTKGIILNVNSPGGTPVQAGYIYDEIRRIKAEHPDLPIYAVVGDVCASGGYYIAAAADKIFVNQASIIGSIGVIMNNFGFTNVLDRLGIERRTLTAGEHKALLDPFSPANSQETKHMQSMLDQVHQQFIDAVRKGRGDRLKETADMFSGLVWTGAEGVRLGLADDFGNVDSVARDQLDTEHTLNFTPQERLLDRLAGRMGAYFGHSIATSLGLGQLR